MTASRYGPSVTAIVAPTDPSAIRDSMANRFLTTASPGYGEEPISIREI